MMSRAAAGLLVLGLCGCGSTSYGVNTEGMFPARPAGADYPNWDHMCVVVTKSNATETLNDAGAQGWELVTVGKQGSNDLVCFKRPKAAGNS
jgi:hypothetical protein